MCPVQGRPTPANMEILRRRSLQSCYIVRHVSQDLFLMEHWGSHCWSFFTLCALWNTKISNQIDWWFWISCRTEEWDMMIMMIMMRVSLVQGIYCKSSSCISTALKNIAHGGHDRTVSLPTQIRVQLLPPRFQARQLPRWPGGAGIPDLHSNADDQFFEPCDLWEDILIDYTL